MIKRNESINKSMISKAKTELMAQNENFANNQQQKVSWRKQTVRVKF